jgi:SAM-dependent methyltransferase
MLSIERSLNFAKAVCETYRRTPILQEISESDDMLAHGQPGSHEHYWSVGRSAADLILTALIAAQKGDIQSVLDLPCGGGRVTRHLRAMFPDAELWVSDLNQAKQRFVVETFDAKALPENPAFLLPPARTFDLVFVGSLLTHFDEEKFKHAIQWLLSTLAPDGLLILTTHGRRHQTLQDKCAGVFTDGDWSPVSAAYEQTGFGYMEYAHDPGYGLSQSAAWWVARLLEQDNTTRIVLLKEGAWDDHQDAFVVQKRGL